MSYDLLFQKAIELHNANRLDEAAAIYRQILETAPQNPDVLNLLGLVAQAKGAHPEATELFYQAICQTPEHAPLYFNLAISLDAWDKPIEAIDNLKKAIKLAPDMKEAYITLGDIYRRLNHRLEATSAYEQALNLDKQSVEALTGKALLIEQMPEKISTLEQIIKDYPNSPLPLFELANCYFNMAQYDKASALSSRVVLLLPENPEALNLHAFTLLQTQHPEEAEKYLRRSLQIFPSAKAALALAEILSGKGLSQEAEALFHQAIRLEDKNIEAHINYADFLYHQHRLPEALEEYRAAVILDPKRAEVSNNLGIILKDLGDYEQALGLFFNALALKPDLEEISINLSETLTLFAQNSPKDAVKIAENWVKNTPDNIFARHTLASLKGENFADNQIFAQKLFDAFADNYELVLARLDYRLPNSIREFIGDVKGRIVDLGCGTGLTGLALKTPATELIGVDISQAMLKKAKEKHIYKQLIQKEIQDFLQNQNDKADLYVAADVFNYIGDLKEIIRLISPHPLCFSIENGPNETDFRLTANGRYQHSEQYINKLLNNNGYNLIRKKLLVIRKEDNQEVQGTLYFAQ